MKMRRFVFASLRTVTNNIFAHTQYQSSLSIKMVTIHGRSSYHNFNCSNSNWILLCPIIAGLAQEANNNQSEYTPMSESPYDTSAALERLSNSFSTDNINGHPHEFGDIINAQEDNRTGLSLKRIEQQITKTSKDNDKYSKCNRWKWFKDEVSRFASIENIVITTHNYSRTFPDIKGLPSLGRMNYEMFIILDGTNEQWYLCQRDEYLAPREALRYMEQDLETLDPYWSWWMNKNKNRNYHFQYGSKYGLQSGSGTKGNIRPGKNMQSGRKRKNHNFSNSSNMLSIAPPPPIKKRRVGYQQQNVISLPPLAINNNNYTYASATNNFMHSANNIMMPPSNFTPINYNNSSFNQLMTSIDPYKSTAIAPPSGTVLKQRKKSKNISTKSIKKDKRKQSSELGNLECGLDKIIAQESKIGQAKYDKRASLLTIFYCMESCVDDNDKKKYLQSYHIKRITNNAFNHSKFYMNDSLQTGKTHTYNQIDTTGGCYTFHESSKAKKLIATKFANNKALKIKFEKDIKKYIEENKNIEEANNKKKDEKKKKRKTSKSKKKQSDDNNNNDKDKDNDTCDDVNVTQLIENGMEIDNNSGMEIENGMNSSSNDLESKLKKRRDSIASCMTDMNLQELDAFEKMMNYFQK